MKKRNVDFVLQFGIFVFGISSVVSIGIFEDPFLGCIFGLIAEPFWFATAWRNRQWGIFCLAVVYAISWTVGIYNYTH